MDLANESIRQVVGQMTSDFNMISGAPSVQYFEGLEGVKKVLEDSLYAKEEILAYSDLESIEKYLKKENVEYVKEREKYEVKKRGLVLDTDFNRKFLDGYNQTVTDTRLLPLGTDPFKTIMQIYDDKVSYITFVEKEVAQDGASISKPNIISVLITNPAIATLHKNFLNLIGKILKGCSFYFYSLFLFSIPSIKTPKCGSFSETILPTKNFPYFESSNFPIGLGKLLPSTKVILLI